MKAAKFVLGRFSVSLLSYGGGGGDASSSH